MLIFCFFLADTSRPKVLIQYSYLNPFWFAILKITFFCRCPDKSSLPSPGGGGLARGGARMGGGSSPYSGAQGASFASAAAPYLPPPAPAPPDPYDRYLLHQHNLHPHHHHHHPPHHYSLHHYDVLPPPPPQPTTATRERYDRSVQRNEIVDILSLSTKKNTVL
ncbi:hypothetical protein LSTR_LSTR017550 [Laodelphax striatellus]|uniref:Uncharacterized protein n=1 Tax=Laodelphax striatellus TaxID=195883 RepID=A0A482X6E1_LAOST|nr:hypothetical protein LSTR_LSTR017550 [Laodelphax striatellus]